MSERAHPPSKPKLGTVIVLAVLLSAGYYGFTTLREEIRAQQTQARGVIIDLKKQAVGEIRAVRTEAVKEIKTLSAKAAAGMGARGGGDGGVGAGDVQALTDLKLTVETIHAEQKAMAERLAAIQGGPGHRPPAMPAPGTRADTLNKTVYFPLAVAKGPKIDKQLAPIVPELKKYAGNRTCRANVFGFSDTLGNDSSNLKLSQRRAEYVAAKLKAQGLSVGTVKGWGERWLDVYTTDGVKNDKNRRTVIEMDCVAKPAPAGSTPSS